MKIYILILIIICNIINLFWYYKLCKTNEEWGELTRRINNMWYEHCRELIDKIIKVEEEVNALKKTVDEM